MAQFDVHRNVGRNRMAYPFLVVVQSRRFDDLLSRLVVPVGSLPRRRSFATPVVTVLGQEYVLMAHDMFAAPLRVLGPVVTSLAEEAMQIVTAIDDVITTAYG